MQFIGGLPIYLYGYFYHSYCIYGILYDLSMIVLFGNFYLRAYVLPRKSKEKAQ